jgi:flagellar hook protein FlgE
MTEGETVPLIGRKKEMMRSMYSGVSGLRVHQAKMDVIGNNISNVNTVGFKRSQVTFSEVFAQTIKGAGSPEGGRGGTNPQQIGLGAGLSSIDVIHSKGSTQRTDNATDIMVDGNGFFIVSADENAQNKFYTRAGNFSVDKLGYLVTPSGFKVLDSTFQPVQINKSETKNATETSEIEVKGNLNFNSEIDPDTLAAYTTSLDVYDQVGNVTTVTLNFGEKFASVDGTFSYRSVQIPNPDGTNALGDLTQIIADGTTVAGEHVFAEFDANGNFVRLVDTAAVSGFPADPRIDQATVVDYSGTLTITVPGADTVDLPINNDVFSNFTQFSATSDAKAVPINGNSAGSLDSFSISSSGEVTGIFTNGERKTLATIGLADFDNPAGLMKVGNNLYADTPNSGAAKFGTPGSGSFGQLTPGALEMSNVDLSQEFTDMITTQRGFQANSRVITTTDEMLQELVNLKR